MTVGFHRKGSGVKGTKVSAAKANQEWLLCAKHLATKAP